MCRYTHINIEAQATHSKISPAPLNGKSPRIQKERYLIGLFCICVYIPTNNYESLVHTLENQRESVVAVCWCVVAVCRCVAVYQKSPTSHSRTLSHAHSLPHTHTPSPKLARASYTVCCCSVLVCCCSVLVCCCSVLVCCCSVLVCCSVSKEPYA